MLFDKPQEKDNANDKPRTANESVYDAATGKYGVWIDGEFDIDANTRHEDDPNSIIKQEIKEEPGLMDDLAMDYMEDGMMDMNNNMLPVILFDLSNKKLFAYLLLLFICSLIND